MKPQILKMTKMLIKASLKWWYLFRALEILLRKQFFLFQGQKCLMGQNH